MTRYITNVRTEQDSLVPSLVGDEISEWQNYAHVSGGPANAIIISDCRTEKRVLRGDYP
jgi:hypothetical protein